MTYCTLDEAQAELKAQDTTSAEVPKLQRYIRQVSRRIDLLMNSIKRRPYFEPYIEARSFPLDTRHVSNLQNVFHLDNLLLEFSSVTAGGTDITSLVELYPPDGPLYKALRFLSAGNSWYTYYPGTDARWPAYVRVTGTWGFHDDYDNAWVTYDQITTAALTPAAISVSVNDVDGDDPDGFTPRFSPGQLVRFGSNAEISEVISTDTATNAVGLRRHVNGSDAATGDYAIGTDIKVWQVEEPIKRITARQSALLYARRGAFQVTEIDGIGVTTYPADLLTELAQTLVDYMP